MRTLSTIFFTFLTIGSVHACPFSDGKKVATPDGREGVISDVFSSGADAVEAATVTFSDGSRVRFSNQPGMDVGVNDLCTLKEIPAVAAPNPEKHASCPSIPPFADGIRETAEEYASSGKFSLDPDGILVYDYGQSYGGLGKWANPFFNSRYANALYADWYKGGCVNDDLKEKFIRHADWFSKTFKDRNGMAVWDYPFKNTHYDVPAGWISGIGQSHIASILYRSFLLTGDQKFKGLSEKAMEVYFRPMSEGGVITEDETGFWIQEIPNPLGIAHSVLNGHITAIFGIMDMEALSHDPRYQSIIVKSIDAVRSQIRNFDAGTTSYYELRPTPGESRKLAPVKGYNAFHVSQLRRLYKIDGDPVFNEMADLFASYVKAANDADTANRP